MEKPTLPKGTRDFGPAMMAKRQFIIGVIKKVFERYGFQQLETPAMENLSTLTGKYGEEGDQLLFKVLNSGDFMKISDSELDLELNNTLTFSIAELTDLFDRVNHKLGTNKQRPIEEIIKIVLEEANEIREKIRCKIPLKTIVEFFHKEISESILEWLNRPQSTNKSDLSAAIEHFKTRNLRIQSVKELVLKNPIALRNFISDKGLRYDLTVPFARYVVMNRHEVNTPFKRSQIQPVWRADRPQKGRYREFYQCDADVIGTDSLLCEAEIILMIREVMDQLGFKDYTIKVNHRGILSALAELAGAKGNESALFVAIDKLDKIGEAKVKEELGNKGFDAASVDRIFKILNFKGSNLEKIDFLSSQIGSSTKGKKGIKDMSDILSLLSRFDLAAEAFELDIPLARGLSYYTGTIFEVKINNVAIGSVSGGGRYDDLTGVFGDKEKLSGVGISFGLDRLYDALEELNLFPSGTEVSSRVMVAHLDEASMLYGIKVLKALRDEGIASELYPDITKIKKQLDYANRKKIPYVIVIGEEEMKSGQLTFKDMQKGEQQKLPLNEILISF